jgi:hypothetical protein
MDPKQPAATIMDSQSTGPAKLLSLGTQLALAYNNLIDEYASGHEITDADYDRVSHAFTAYKTLTSKSVTALTSLPTYSDDKHGRYVRQHGERLKRVEVSMGYTVTAIKGLDEQGVEKVKAMFYKSEAYRTSQQRGFSSQVMDLVVTCQTINTITRSGK